MPELLKQPREQSGWSLGSAEVDGEGLKMPHDVFLKGFCNVLKKGITSVPDEFSFRIFIWDVEEAGQCTRPRFKRGLAAFGF